MSTSILVRCVSCSAERTIPMPEAAQLNDVPSCPTCGQPMATVKVLAELAPARPAAPASPNVDAEAPAPMGMGPGHMVDPVKDPNWKRRKMHGTQLSDEEAAQLRARLGIK
jgi:hypothetical protein